MNELLAAVLEAHGGLENWERLTKLTAQLSLGGPFWAAPDRTSVFDVDPERVVIEATDGQVVEERTNPRDSRRVRRNGQRNSRA